MLPEAIQIDAYIGMYDDIKICIEDIAFIATEKDDIIKPHIQTKQTIVKIVW